MEFIDNIVSQSAQYYLSWVKNGSDDGKDSALLSWMKKNPDLINLTLELKRGSRYKHQTFADKDKLSFRAITANAIDRTIGLPTCAFFPLYYLSKHSGITREYYDNSPIIQDMIHS